MDRTGRGDRVIYGEGQFLFSFRAVSGPILLRPFSAREIYGDAPSSAISGWVVDAIMTDISSRRTQIKLPTAF
jgi:hypothetical protein